MRTAVDCRKLRRRRKRRTATRRDALSFVLRCRVLYVRSACVLPPDRGEASAAGGRRLASAHRHPADGSARLPIAPPPLAPRRLSDRCAVLCGAERCCAVRLMIAAHTCSAQWKRFGNVLLFVTNEHRFAIGDRNAALGFGLSVSRFASVCFVWSPSLTHSLSSAPFTYHYIICILAPNALHI